MPPAVALPLFLGATASVNATDRQSYRQVLKRLGHHKGFADNLSSIEVLWQLIDTTGRTVPWLELVQQGVIPPPAFP